MVVPASTTPVLPVMDEPPLLSTLVIDGSINTVTVSVSVAVLLARLLSVSPLGGVMVAVLTKVPVALGLILAEKEKVTLASTGKSTLVLKAPVPLLGLPALMAPPPVAPTNVQLSLVTPTGTASKMLAPLATLGPLLLTTIV